MAWSDGRRQGAALGRFQSPQIILAQGADAGLRVYLRCGKLQVTQKLLDLVNRDFTRVEQYGSDRMAQEMRVHAFGDAGRQRAFFHDILDSSNGVFRVPVAFKEISLDASLQMRAQLLGQRRQDRDIAAHLPLGVGDMDLGRIAVEMQVLDFDVDEFLDARAGKKKCFYYEPVFTFRAVVGAFDQTLDLGLV